MIEAFTQIREIHQVFGEAQQVLEEDIGRPICIPNCGLCCEHNIPFTMTIEAVYAVSVLTGTGRLKKIVKMAEGWLLEHHPFATVFEGMPHGFASPKLKEEWQAVIHSQCPFLDTVTKACLVHDCRPFACRAWGVTRDGAGICPRPLGRGETETQRRYITAEGLRSYIRQCRKGWERKNKTWIIAGTFPAVLYRAAEPEKFRKYVLDNRIASAKIIGVDFESSLMWQPQVEALRGGVSPDLVVSRN
jgi:Fe-S-cluster containining protein